MSRLELQRLQPDQHDSTAFSCGEPRIDAYLQQRAAQHSRDGLSITHVLLDAEREGAKRILGFYTLAPAIVRLVDAAPVAAVRMTKLAVASQYQGCGHGQLLLAAAVQRCLQMRAELHIRALVADVLNARAGRFYREYGFRAISSNAMTLYLALSAVRIESVAT